MKKTVVWFLLLLSFLFLFGCEKEEITALRTKEEIVYLPLGGSFSIENHIEKEGDGELFYAVEHTEVLSLKGSTVTAVGEGKGYVSVWNDRFFIRFAVSVTNKNKVILKVADQSVVYDGNSRLPEYIAENMPEGGTVTFWNGKDIFTGATEAGTYTLTAVVNVPSAYTVEGNNQTIQFTVRKKSFDLSDITFGNTTVTYDGTEKELKIGGTLPEGVSVRYENNKHTDVGEYVAKAYFILPDDKNYVEISPLSARLTIAKKFINLSLYGLCDQEITYDGTPHTVAVTNGTLPAGVALSYVGESTFTDSGKYTVSMTFDCEEEIGKNYAFMQGEKELSVVLSNGVYRGNMTFLLTIQKAFFTSSYRWKMTKEGQTVATIRYGQTIGIGEEKEIFIRYEGFSAGKGGEYPQGATIRYTSTIKENTYGKVNAGNYSVTATFVMPEGSEKNYYPLEQSIFTFIVDKAEYPLNAVTFTYPVQRAEFDPSVWYNDFAVTCTDDTIWDDVSVSYTYSLEGIHMGVLQSNSVYHAGSYVVYAKFELLMPDKNQYVTPASKQVSLVITPKYFTLNSDFSSATYTYDGEGKSLSVQGTLPEGVGVLYEQNKHQSYEPLLFSQAGNYTITATYYYKNWAVCDYVIYGKNGTETQTATLTIRKAVYTDVDPSRYTQADIPTFSPTLTVGDITLLNNADGFVRWKTPTASVKLISRNESEHTGKCYPLAIYNRDTENYEDFSFSVEVTVKQVAIDLSAVTVPTQFVSNQTWSFSYTGATAYQSYITARGEGEGLTSIGKHLCTVTLAVTEPNHYYFVGSNVFLNVTVYTYDGKAFSYAPASATLVSYCGKDKILTVPEGTTALAKGAFASSSVQELILPDTLLTIGKGTLSGTDSLQKLSLASLPDSVTACFTEVPTSLAEIIVREDTAIADNAFIGLRNVRKITYEKAVQTVGDNAFRNCLSLQTLSLVSVPEEVGATCFYGCKSLVSLSVSYIGKKNQTQPLSALFGADTPANSYKEYALATLSVTRQTVFADGTFADFVSLKEISFSPSVTAFGRASFRNLTCAVDLSCQTSTVLSAYLFEGFQGTFVLPNRLTTVSACAFSGYEGEVRLPDTVVNLEPNAFSDCVGSVLFGKNSSLTEIGTKAFYHYLGKEISFPKNLTSIGISAFETSAITSLVIPAGVTVGENAFRSCSALIDLSFDGISVGKRAFYDCTALTEVTFSASLQTLSAYAFYNCTALKTVIFDGQAPACEEGVFLSSNNGYAVTFMVLSEYYRDFVTYCTQCANMDKANLKRK